MKTKLIFRLSTMSALFVAAAGLTLSSPPEKCTETVGTVSASPNVLFPPNHKFVDVTINYLPGCLPAFCTLSVTSNEPVNGGGDGNTSQDWKVVNANHVLLRAERSGEGTGRIYAVKITCSGGNLGPGTATVNVTVPHN